MKLLESAKAVRSAVSHPSWVCGLKLEIKKAEEERKRSHPSWVCGLKQRWHWVLWRKLLSHPSWVCGLKQMYFLWLQLMWQKSHPSWVCGLKRYFRGDCVGLPESHPSWVCGLKHRTSNHPRVSLRSHPSWVCGLKHLLQLFKRDWNVTPFVGVWIETCRRHQQSGRYKRHTLRGCVD